MKLRVIFNTGGVATPVNLIELDALGYTINERTGALTILRKNGEAHEPVVVYAAGVWRSCTDVGALKAAIEAVATPQPEVPRENPRRRQAARQVPAP